MTIKDLKLEHDGYVIEGRQLLEQIERLAKKVEALRMSIKEGDPDEYDEIKLLFQGTFDEEQ